MVYRKFASVLLFVASVASATYALLPQLVTLATNDPHDYQPLLRTGIAWSAVSIASMVAYVAFARGRWRTTVAIPICICAIAWWGIARMWPYAFAP
jgi:hypothetical protein